VAAPIRPGDTPPAAAAVPPRPNLRAGLLRRHAERRAAAAVCSQGRLFASLLTGLYLTFKLAALVERLRATLAMGRSLLLHQPPFGKYATTEAVLEAGDEVCAICQEHMSSPVLLDSCSHLFCEECILAWCERRPDPTCPLCRAPLATSMGAHSDGTTSLLPQVF